MFKKLFKFLYVYKRRITYSGLCVVLGGVIAASLIADIVSLPVYARTGEFHVVIDAGHGGRDGGAVSANGTKESDINLAISKYLVSELGNYGVGVTLTRETKDSLANPFAKNKKRDDMEKRRQIIEKVAPDLVISIHLNNFPSHPAVRGLQTFYAKDTSDQSGGSDDTESDIKRNGEYYAVKIQEAINASSLNINRKAALGDYYILKCTAYPTVMVECGFLSNPQEEKLLKSSEYQKILAQHIALAVI